MRVPDFDHCLEHLERSGQDEYFRGLSLGAEVDLRGTGLSGELVGRLVDAVGSIDGRRAEFGRADFAGARFHGLVVFEDVTFFDADFTDATFEGAARFDKAGFRDSASFLRSRFGGSVTFEDVSFEDTSFAETRFGGRVSFENAKFETDVSFSHGFPDQVSFAGAEFAGEAGFGSLLFDGRALFNGAKFHGAATFTESRFKDHACFKDSRFDGDVKFEGVRFEATARFRGAEFTAAERFGPVTAEHLIFGRATFRRRMLVTAEAPAMDCAETRFEEGVTLRLGANSAAGLQRTIFGKASTVMGPASVKSVEGTDVADVVFTDIDLASCLFTGAHHLDKLRLEGDCGFGSYRKRQVLAEERAWRRDRNAPVGPRRIADLYRQLRKAQEDSKNEPGAADFYYGEMEMRRHSPATPWSERVILHLYWLVSGYGLRALRALATLAVLIAVVSTSIWLGGFKTTPAFGDTLIYVAQSTVSLETKLASLPKELTPFGEVLRLVTRVLGPLLLGLTLLAVRNRVKR
ncbi:pentapeptide repeat-containing protein [Amycolatopsis sp. EV170708-02-1]|uniref:pentapeptide repeat-containing protein n=1 Tax=Amycolatopsis sp. EV170708-02-1 TaxID=2919322 RepID=UPI001F0BBEDC|nr:pentapeptide repeat-containing protein [Amycolatopsis sp. EV170708-02-1]UMP00492.1 pentapeptide repeat-containing protein [Amycolatopsis sp. EV170708-02-1]